MTPRRPLLRAAFHVSGSSGVQWLPRIGRTPTDTTAFMLANEAESGFPNHPFSPERDQLYWKAFGRRDTPPLQSEIVVLSDSPIQTLEQLAGQPVAFPGPEAPVACKSSGAHLQNRKVPVALRRLWRSVPSNGSEYGVYRSFYQTAPVHLR